MAVNKGEIGIYGVLKRDGGDGVIATADQIKDTLRGEIQEDLNAEYHAAKLNLEDHLEDTNNPHSVTKAQVGLGNVTNDALVKRSELGKAFGVATLDTSGKVPASQLPSFVNDVLEYATLSKFPAKGEDGKIYVTLDTNLTYRWSGTQYVEISQSLAVGETADSAFAGSRGKALETNLQLEITDRLTADATLQTNIDNVSKTVTDNKTETDSAISNVSTALSNYKTEVDNYVTASLLNLSGNPGYHEYSYNTSISLNANDFENLLKIQNFSASGTLKSKATYSVLGGLDENINIYYNEEYDTLLDTDYGVGSTLNSTINGSFRSYNDIKSISWEGSHSKAYNILETSLNKLGLLITLACYNTSNNLYIANCVSGGNNLIGIHITGKTSNDLLTASYGTKTIGTDIASQEAVDAKVDKTTTINNKPLSSNITLDKSDIGLTNVDNTSDLAKPISTATLKALNTKFGNDAVRTKNTFCAAPASANGVASFRSIEEEDLSSAITACTTDEINELFT